MGADFKPFLSSQDLSATRQTFFEDELIKNNDARVLKNLSGGIILGYSIFNQKFVIISTSIEALSTVLERLIILPPR